MDARVLLTGATGYIGGRLLRQLEEGGRAVRCLARQPGRRPSDPADHRSGSGATASTRPRSTVRSRACDAPITSCIRWRRGSDFADVDRRAADNFGRAAARAGVRRIIYLGGLADDAGVAVGASEEPGRDRATVLRASGVPVIEFRASIVIGAGSLSFEMIQALVERLPVMVCPRWVATLTQPIAIDDVVAYLAAALDLPRTRRAAMFEIGGPEVVSYGDMMREYARLRGLRRLLLPVPLLTPHLSGLWLALVTPAQARVGRALVEGLRNSTVVRSPAARDAFRHRADAAARRVAPKRSRRASRRAQQVDTRDDRRRRAACAGVRADPAHRRRHRLVFRQPALAGARAGSTAGSEASACAAGVAIRSDCAVGDVIDGWTVEAYEPDRRLRLSADMKLPGRGWLEFEVTPLDGGRRSTIRQTATFDPRGLLGRAYWYAILPLHGAAVPRHAASASPRACREGARLVAA